MKTQNALCPSDSALSDFGLGKLDATSAETVSQHLETCDGCRQRVASLPGDSFVERLRDVGNNSKVGRTPPKAQRTFVPGESIAGVSSSDTSQSDIPRTSPAVAIEKAPPELANHPDYELKQQLGQGGMGTVYLARHRITHRLEVLKVVSKSLLAHPGAMERFQHEIRSACSLAHPNVVAAYGVLHLGDLLIFVMEYVKGHDLSQVVKRRGGSLPVANAAFYGHQAALGLQHAHEKGMVHRDIKPNNLMLAVERKRHIVKILDFGLAKSASGKAADHGLTKSGQMLGTPDYVAPEQTLAANKADIRSDIYSLGCTLYFLLSGGPPFEEASLYGILDAHQKRDPRPLNLVRPEVPVELATVVAKMMAKDPAKRYQTPIEVARALVPFFKPGQSAVSPPAGTGPSQPTAETEDGLPAATPASPIAAPPLPFPVPVAARPVAVAAPAPRPTTDAVEWFSVLIDTHRPAARRRDWWSLPRWQQWTAVGGAAAILLFGIALLIRTPRGTIEIELSERAKVSVTVDGNNVDIGGLDDRLSLEVGEHDLVVRGKGYETITKKFTVTKGKNAPLTVTLEQKKADPAPAFAGREMGAKHSYMRRFGAPGGTEEAVTSALQWLDKEQRKNGSWSLKGPYSSPSLEARDIPESATALALLAFQGHGSTHKSGTFQKTVASGLKALLELQQEDGSFFNQDAGRPHNWLYTHAQCTMAVCELFGMTRDSALRRSAELAVKFCVASQDPDLGGWRYSPRTDSDTSVTGWMVIALQSAMMAGIEVPNTAWQKVSEYLDKCTVDGSRYGYQAGMEPTISMTAEALLCRQFLGWAQDDLRLVEGADDLLKHLPEWGDRDVYYWYYATQTMHHMEGKYWAAWNAAYAKMLIDHQEMKGVEKGSWDPLGASPDRWASLGQGGRLYVTCLSVYMLETYYRHLPIYELRKVQAKVSAERPKHSDRSAASVDPSSSPVETVPSPTASTPAVTPEGFTALLNGQDLNDWLFPERLGGLTFDDGVIRLTRENDYLLTKRTNFKNFKLRMELSASKGTEAFVVVHHQGPMGSGTAITSTIYDDGTDILAGMSWVNFGRDEHGMKPKSTTYDEFFKLELSMNDLIAWISVDGLTTSGVDYKRRFENWHGALGCVVHKGSLTIRQIEVQELP